MYPVYPILAFVASSTLASAGGLCDARVGAVTASKGGDGKVKAGPARVSKVCSLLYALTIATSLALGVSRVVSNYNNYGGRS